MSTHQELKHRALHVKGNSILEGNPRSPNLNCLATGYRYQFSLHLGPSSSVRWFHSGWSTSTKHEMRRPKDRKREREREVRPRSTSANIALAANVLRASESIFAGRTFLARGCQGSIHPNPTTPQGFRIGNESLSLEGEGKKSSWQPRMSRFHARVIMVLELHQQVKLVVVVAKTEGAGDINMSWRPNEMVAFGQTRTLKIKILSTKKLS